MADLRHSCFRGEEFRPPGNTGDWVQLGAYGAVVTWEEDGLERVAQWSSAGGLHVYTEGLHRNCLRIVCSWSKAKAIVANIRRTNMDELMKRNEEIVSKLVSAADRHVAVVVVGGYGSGKVWLSDMAIRRMGREARTIDASALDEFEAPTVFKTLAPNSGVVLHELHRCTSLQILTMLSVAATEFVRIEGGVLFIMAMPGQESILSHFANVTGETLGLQQTVEVSR